MQVIWPFGSVCFGLAGRVLAFGNGAVLPRKLVRPSDFLVASREFLNRDAPPSDGARAARTELFNC